MSFLLVPVNISNDCIYGVKFNLAKLISFRTVLSAFMAFVWVSTILDAGVGIFAIIKHKDNIKRILKGEEKKITSKKKEA